MPRIGTTSKKTLTITKDWRYVAYLHKIWVSADSPKRGKPRKGTKNGQIAVIVPLNYRDERYEFIEIVTFSRYHAGVGVGLMPYIVEFQYIAQGIDHLLTYRDDYIAFGLSKMGFVDLPASFARKNEKGRYAPINWISYVDYFRRYEVDTVNINDNVYIINSPDRADINLPCYFKIIARGEKKIQVKYGYNHRVDG